MQFLETEATLIAGWPYDVVVEIGGAGLCRTDLHIVEGHWADRSGVASPLIVGAAGRRLPRKGRWRRGRPGAPKFSRSASTPRSRTVFGVGPWLDHAVVEVRPRVPSSAGFTAARENQFLLHVFYTAAGYHVV